MLLEKNKKMATINTKELKKQAKALQAIVRIGKNGITDNLIEEIKKIIKLRKLVKVKFLPSFSDEQDRHEAAKEIAEKTESLLVQVIGNNIVLYKR